MTRSTVVRGGRPVRPTRRVTMLGLRGFPNVQGGVENHAETSVVRVVGSAETSRGRPQRICSAGQQSDLASISSFGYCRRA